MVADTVILKYGIEFSSKAIQASIDRLINQVFKLLPQREEGGEWQTPLQNLIIEVGGLSSLVNNQAELFSLLCKMEGLLNLTNEEDFLLFRKGIFECCNLLVKVKKNVGL